MGESTLSSHDNSFIDKDASRFIFRLFPFWFYVFQKIRCEYGIFYRLSLFTQAIYD